MPFALDLTLSNLGEGSNTAEPDVVDPSSSLGAFSQGQAAGRASSPINSCVASRTFIALRQRTA